VPLTIHPASILSPDAGALIAALNAELDTIYPEPGANHFRLDPDEVAPGRGAFLIAYEDDSPIACGAVRLLSPDEAELKRMYVVPAVRRRGVAHALLHALEAEARRLGARRLVLEAGPRQVAAMTLYHQAGFAEIPRFGEYVDSPLSVCLAKLLT
jgi:GNAT superfamily N-acetyltransferase